MFGYVVEHSNAQYARDDWFASSYILHIKSVGDYFAVTTANSTYQIPNYKTIVIPMAALDNIRMGTPPEKALHIIYGSFSKSIH